MELDHGDEHGKRQVKSYDCIFCKRGFTNAQALGGHMNMHRKDKAKLRVSTMTTDLAITPTQPCSIIRKQLLLFAETPSSKNQKADGNRVYWGSDDKGVLADHDSVSSKPFHLDLELRLGVGGQKRKSL